MYPVIGYNISEIKSYEIENTLVGIKTTCNFTQILLEVPLFRK